MAASRNKVQELRVNVPTDVETRDPSASSKIVDKTLELLVYGPHLNTPSSHDIIQIYFAEPVHVVIQLH